MQILRVVLTDYWFDEIKSGRKKRKSCRRLSGNRRAVKAIWPNVSISLATPFFSSDKINRGFGETIDFLAAENICCTVPFGSFDIATNPPYKLTADFIKRGWRWIENGRKLCLFLKLTFLESVARDDLFGQYPVSRIHVCRKRIKCAKNGDFSKVSSSPTCYAWFVWEKGYTGPTIIDRV